MYDTDRHDAAVAAWWRIAWAWVAALGGLSIAQWTQLIGFLSMIAALTFTCLQIYVLWRDKLREKPQQKVQGEVE
jgi:uncharacterized membrane protein